jgi:hypothetical protein
MMGAKSKGPDNSSFALLIQGVLSKYASVNLFLKLWKSCPQPSPFLGKAAFSNCQTDRPLISFEILQSSGVFPSPCGSASLTLGFGDGRS